MSFLRACGVIGIAVFIALGTAAHGEAVPSQAPQSVGLIEDGFDALVYRMHLVHNAKRSIDVQTFIWKNDASGHAFMDACVDAARRGIKVRFLMDHLYSDVHMDTAVALARAHPNISVKRYRPPHTRLRSGLRRSATHSVLAFRARNQRMHNKCLIVDDLIAIVGGRNISDAYFNQSGASNYLDRELFVEGPLLQDLLESFDAYWDFERSVALEDLRDVRRNIAQGNSSVWGKAEGAQLLFQQKLDERLSDGAAIRARIRSLMHPVTDAWLSVDPPGKNGKDGVLALWGSSDTAEDLLSIMGEAQERILIETPYLIFDRSATRFFRRLVKSRPDSYASTGNMAAYAGTFRSRARAQALGFTVYEMKPHPDSKSDLIPRETVLVEPGDGEPYVSIHAKSMVVDDRISYVGSFNLDPRSIHLNTELGIIVDDAEFAGRLTAPIELLILPGNSWVERERALLFAGVNRKMEWVSRHLPLDVWPISSTVIVDQESDTVVGVLPVDDRWSKKRWMFRVNRALGFVMRPIL